MKFLIKLFPEITIKSRSVRKQQTRVLCQNIRRLLNRMDENIRVVSLWDRIEVDNVAEGPLHGQVAEALQRIPGIGQVLEVRDYPLTTFDEVLERTLPVYREVLAGKTFAVRVKRAGKHPFSSKDLEIHLGSGLMQRTEASGVNLSQPDVTVRIEVRNDRFYIIENRYPGLGGFPIGAVDAVLSLISGGYDSTVSTYMAMRRGLRSHFLFFNLGGTAHEAGVKQVALYLWERYGASHRVRFVTVPFEGVVAELMRHVDHSHMGVILKRMMLRAAERVSQNLKVSALVTGESVAQVSSQTLANLTVIDKATDMLVMRPLGLMDKQEIIRLSVEIGTEEFARNMPEYCGVISDRPTVCAKPERVAEEEARFDFSVLDEALAARRVMYVDEVLDAMETPCGEVESVQTPRVEDVVIDIRHPGEEERSPLVLTNNEILRIPFYELNERFVDLPAQRRYLLYCDQGTMSRLHAGHLKAAGHGNVLVFSPNA